MLTTIEQSRLALSQATDPRKKSQLGQFFTPAGIAQFMARLFVQNTNSKCRLLDAGAGIGSLSAAYLGRCVSGDFEFTDVSVDAFEIDHRLHHSLNRTLDEYRRRVALHGVRVVTTIRGQDFVYAAVDSLSNSLFSERIPRYTHAILNPPYRKIRSDSSYRSALRSVGIETVNLYSAFVALALSLLDEEHGQLVVIIPRSFCNGPYYRPFRNHILSRAALRHIHLFASRAKAFKDDDVLQENVIIMLQRGVRQREVKITTSTDDSFLDLETYDCPFEQVVLPTDSDRFIQVPISSGEKLVESISSIQYTLEQIGIKVSTGPVVDFRMKAQLRAHAAADTVPLIYPSHVKGWHTNWPIEGNKKPNAIIHDTITERWLYPNGFYCVVRRFSSKEENRRIVASVIRPNDFHGYQALGFENHLNVFHNARNGLSATLAHGLTVFLNSTIVDEQFRIFNGHTQVNATDLRRMKYPSGQSLRDLGRWAMQCDVHTQDAIDEQIASLVDAE